MKVVAIVQARMGSTRLPGKVLLPLAGVPVLGHVIQRLSSCRSLHQIVVATSVQADDDAIAAWCDDQQVACFRGSENDVLDRYYHAATHFCAQAVVRITSDCPAIDPCLVDEVIQGFLLGGYDSYSLAGQFPDGLDCQVFAYSALARAWREATLPSEREHVGPYIERTHPELFKLGGLEKFRGLAHHRWTLDEPDDYTFLCAVFERLYRPGKVFLAQDVLALLEQEPGLMQLNGGMVRNEGYLKSLKAEQSHDVQPR